MPDIPQIPPCVAEQSQTNILATAVALLTQGSGNAPAVHALVAVAGNDVAALPAGNYQSVFIKNTGTAVLRVRFSSATANSSGANGEIPLAAESTAGAGNGGSITVSNIVGPVSLACATSTNAAVVYSS
jgi:hypothetical protein